MRKKEKVIYFRLLQWGLNRLCWLLQRGYNRLCCMLQEGQKRPCWLNMRAELLSIRLSRLSLNESRWQPKLTNYFIDTCSNFIIHVITILSDILLSEDIILNLIFLRPYICLTLWRHRDRIVPQDTDTFYEKYLHWWQLCSHRALIERFQLDPFTEIYYAIATHSKGFEPATIQNG